MFIIITSLNVGVFARYLGHESGAPMNGISILVKEILESSLISPSMQGHSWKAAAMNQEAGPHQTPHLLAP